MRVHRLIFRLDFRRPSFSIIDSPGSVMRLLSEMGDENYWPEFKDSKTSRVVAASSHDADKGVFRQFTVEPTSLHFLIECRVGFSPRTMLTDDRLAPLFKGVHSVCEHFQLKDFARSGVRTISLGSVGRSVDLLEQTLKLSSTKLVEKATATLGKITDSAIAFDGEDEDQLSYHLRAGPYAHDEAPKHFSAEFAQALAEGGEAANFMVDLDFFELNFLLAVRASQWCKIPLNKTEKLMAALPELLAGE